MLDTPIHIPDGTRVELDITEPQEDPGRWVKDFAGCVKDMPEDAPLHCHTAPYGAKKR